MTAAECVLDADVKRKELLAEEKRLNDLIADVAEVDESLQAELNKVRIMTFYLLYSA